MPAWFPSFVSCEDDLEAAQQQWEAYQKDLEEMREKGEI